MTTPEPRRRLPAGWRLDHQGEQIYRLWRVGADRPAGVIASGYNSWTARPFGPAGHRRSWETPTLREAAALLIAHLEAVRVEPVAGRPERLEAFARWLISLDDAGAFERRSATLTQIISRARTALGEENDTDG